MMCGFQDLKKTNACVAWVLTRLTPVIAQGKESLNVDSDGFYYVYFDVLQFTLLLKYFFLFLTIHNKKIAEKKTVIFKPSTT